MSQITTKQLFFQSSYDILIIIGKTVFFLEQTVVELL